MSRNLLVMHGILLPGTSRMDGPGALVGRASAGRTWVVGASRLELPRNGWSVRRDKVCPDQSAGAVWGGRSQDGRRVVRWCGLVRRPVLVGPVAIRRSVAMRPGLGGREA